MRKFARDFFFLDEVPLLTLIYFKDLQFKEIEMNGNDIMRYSLNLLKMELAMPCNMPTIVEAGMTSEFMACVPAQINLLKLAVWPCVCAFSPLCPVCHICTIRKIEWFLLLIFFPHALLFAYKLERNTTLLAVPDAIQVACCAGLVSRHLPYRGQHDIVTDWMLTPSSFQDGTVTCHSQ